MVIYVIETGNQWESLNHKLNTYIQPSFLQVFTTYNELSYWIDICKINLFHDFSNDKSYFWFHCIQMYYHHIRKRYIMYHRYFDEILICLEHTFDIQNRFNSCHLYQNTVKACCHQKIRHLNFFMTSKTNSAFENQI